MLFVFPEDFSVAFTVKIELTSISKLTSIEGSPFGFCGIPINLNSAIL
jgi:hypothetical protein